MANASQGVDKRLKRIQGQVAGIGRMIQEGKPCQDILTQVAAASAALKTIGSLVLTEYAADCINKPGKAAAKQEELKKLLNTIHGFVK